MAAMPPGWQPHVVTPISQQEAQDTVLGYFEMTLQALPPGAVIVATDYGGAETTGPCNGAVAGTDPPQEFSAIGQLETPGPGSDRTVVAVGDTWRSWGWWVFERDGLAKPNRFGYAPDGYAFQIQVSDPPGYSPIVSAISPCYSHAAARADAPFPAMISADGRLDDVGASRPVSYGIQFVSHNGVSGRSHAFRSAR
ncbi:hypothetical protein KV112_06825 [Mycolicibacter sp. MYC123]|uniref:Uncharacterized protein n=1 Tax=[Mycobacterium] zoologicum TaxID=2872311 RepID=A0ABU5YHW3_9MYCO|nr:hypothetical protein [Mycolicibacter sp. MYC123]MEB3049455.1 hypothetical protein [Mycolicibacter sp. MYC123]